MSTPSVGAVMSILMSTKTPADALAERKMSSGVAWWASWAEMGNEVVKGKEGGKKKKCSKTNKKSTQKSTRSPLPTARYATEENAKKREWETAGSSNP
jgi:hypothetical protein